MAFWNRSDRHLNPDEVRMTLGEHLEELRSRIVRALVALMAGAIICYVFIGPIVGLLTWPIYRALAKQGLPPEMYNTAGQEAVVLELKIAVMAGLILTAPYGLSQIWGFVAAGLYPKERRWVRRFVPVSIILFFVGAFFMLFAVAPVMFDFFLSYRVSYPDPSEYLPESLRPLKGDPMKVNTPETQPVWPSGPSLPAYLNDPPNAPEGCPWANESLHEIHVRYGSKTYAVGPLREVHSGNRVVPLMNLQDNVLMILGMMAAFGIGFQMPVVVALLATIGIANAKQMASVRRHVYFVIAIASAAITPSSDYMSMMALMGPMVVLFEVGLLTARIIERERAKPAS